MSSNSDIVTLKQSANAAVLLVKLPKKNAKYSKRNRTRQELESAVLVGARRLTKALDKGLETYVEERDESASASKDGAIKDSLRNVARGMRVFNSHAAEAPAEFVEAVAEMKVTKKLLRRGLKIRLFR